MKEPKKVDKRSKTYRDYKKKLIPATDINKYQIVNHLPEYKVTDAITIKQQSHQAQLQELEQKYKDVWAIVKVLQEQVKNLENKVG